MMRRLTTREERILDGLLLDGFDLSEVSLTGGVHVGCSQCSAAVICGVPCHETGCPRQAWECRGCSARVGRPGAYCADCAC